MLKPVLHRRALSAAIAAGGLGCFGLGVLAAAALARWAARLAPVEPEADDLWWAPPAAGLLVAVPSRDAGIQKQVGPRYAGGIMQQAVNG